MQLSKKIIISALVGSLTTEDVNAIKLNAPKIVG